MNYRLIFALAVVLIIVAAVMYYNGSGEIDLSAPTLPSVFNPPATTSPTLPTTGGSAPTNTPAPATSGSTPTAPTDSSPTNAPAPSAPAPTLPYEEQETAPATTPATSPTPSTPAPSTPVVTPSAPAVTPVQTYIPVVTPVMNAINNYRKVLNAEFYGLDLPNGGSSVATEEQCAAACNSRPDCAFFSYRASDGGCWLKAPTAENYNSVTAIKRGDGTYVSYPKTDVFGNDIADYPGLTTAQCAQKCTDNPKCDMYHSLNNNSCWIKAAAPTQGVNAYFRKSVYN